MQTKTQTNIEMTKHQAVGMSDAGRIRTLNEDTVYCGDNLWLVADGMGGHACGEVASRLAAVTIADEFSRLGNLMASIALAHEKVLQVARHTRQHEGMGTTIVALTCVDDTFEIAWAGDSRAYLWQARSKSLIRLTTDHSLVAELINRGIITAAQAKTHPQRNLITRCLGGNGKGCLQADSIEGKWQSPDKILLCSDGLTDELDEQQIAVILQGAGSDAQQLTQMVEQANAAGGRDNISVVLVQHYPK